MVSLPARLDETHESVCKPRGSLGSDLLMLTITYSLMHTDIRLHLDS